MIQVLDRAFKILEWIAERPGKTFSISEMASLIEVSPSTCFHIVNSLVSLGYVQRIGRYKGYKLGPAFNKLAGRKAFRQELMDAALPHMHEFARESGETIMIAVLQGPKRYILCQVEGKHPLQFNQNLLVLEDAYNTATGRLLLSFMPEEELDSFIGQAGLPRESQWKNVNDKIHLNAALAGIRGKKYVADTQNPHIAQIAFPIYENGKATAALGSFVPLYRYKGTHKADIIESLSDISKKLST